MDLSFEAMAVKKAIEAGLTECEDMLGQIPSSL